MERHNKSEQQKSLQQIAYAPKRTQIRGGGGSEKVGHALELVNFDQLSRQ